MTAADPVPHCDMEWAGPESGSNSAVLNTSSNVDDKLSLTFVVVVIN